MTTVVINKHHYGGQSPPDAVNIMRGSPFGNPFPVGPNQYTREQAIDLYRYYLWKRLQLEPSFARQVRELQGRRLCCCCAPLACHGDVLARAAEWLNRSPERTS